jgi:hypothetical protein
MGARFAAMTVCVTARPNAKSMRRTSRENYFFARANCAAVALIDTRGMTITHSTLLKDGLGLAGVEDMADSHGPHAGRLADI